MAKLHFGSKEYFEKQSEFWFKENSKHISERDAYKKQRDELINDMVDIKRKAEAFDEIVKANDKSDSPEDFGDLVWGILMDYGVIHLEG